MILKVLAACSAIVLAFGLLAYFGLDQRLRRFRWWE